MLILPLHSEGCVYFSVAKRTNPSSYNYIFNGWIEVTITYILKSNLKSSTSKGLSTYSDKIYWERYFRSEILLVRNIPFPWDLFVGLPIYHLCGFLIMSWVSIPLSLGKTYENGMKLNYFIPYVFCIRKILRYNESLRVISNELGKWFIFWYLPNDVYVAEFALPHVHIILGSVLSF